MTRLLALALAAVFLAGCSSTKDAVATGGKFQFVAPGGQTTIFYDPPESRGAVKGISGDSLLHDGATVGLDDYAGNVVVVNIWGSWCGPCREEMPGLQFVQEQTGAAVLGIDVRDERQAAADFVRDRGVSFDSIFDPPGRVLARLSGYPRNTVPSTLVLDRQHRVAAVFLTAVRVPELVPLVQRLQAEPPPAV
ncbi:TlpA family protein disulfide reductase [Pseudonocardia adelaidensis]|uniref:TlpA disulfide reductase family protein n=1 Tax=Pseudonocardia adelaidensis TaxID=648754 RepID=A0ABP9NJH3_9PSEU